MNSQPTTLLDAGDTSRRLLQQALPVAGLLCILGGIGLFVSSPGRSPVPAVALIVAGAGALFSAPWLRVRWTVGYKGHRIRFQNDPVFGERLYIDDESFSSGPLGYAKTLEGTIRSGDGAGERITARSVAGLITFRCRITAEP
jgi:hypothetical protein